jgi:hypothetical protein
MEALFQYAMGEADPGYEGCTSSYKLW